MSCGPYLKFSLHVTCNLHQWTDVFTKTPVWTISLLSKLGFKPYTNILLGLFLEYSISKYLIMQSYRSINMKSCSLCCLQIGYQVPYLYCVQKCIGHCFQAHVDWCFVITFLNRLDEFQNKPSKMYKVCFIDTIVILSKPWGVIYGFTTDLLPKQYCHTLLSHSFNTIFLYKRS